MSRALSILNDARGKATVAGSLAALLLLIASPAPAGGSTMAGGRHSAGTHGGQGYLGTGHSVGRRPPKPQPDYWGAWIGDQLTGEEPPWDMSAVTEFEQLTGRGLSLLEFSQPFYDCSTLPCTPFRFPAGEMEKIRNYGAIPFLSLASDSLPVPESGEEPEFQLADVLAGNYDSYIRKFAEEARNWGHPFFLRFNWEMNGNWFPWGQGINGNQPSEAIPAWRRVHDIFAEVGATNATWVWCPYADTFHRFGDLAELYPGSAYVDWTCMDGYNWAKNPTNPHPWRSFDEIFDSTYKTIRRIAPEKPIVLAEIASTGSGPTKAAWIRDMFRQLVTNYRQIRGLIWLDQVNRSIDWPIETSPATTRAFAWGIRRWAFKSNGYASVSTAPVQPPG